jgi:NO-binding membrane sensor protein with MHYT domain
VHHVDIAYNWFLVALSFFVSVFGSYTALQLMRGLRSAAKSSQYLWLFAAAFALGGGAIWTMHFIGMIAYHSGMEVGYDPVLTFISLLVAVVMVGIGIFILSKKPDSIGFLLIAGVITGLGVASMHYSGMAAMIVAADISYDPMLFSLSLVIAVVAATAALWLAFNLDGGIQIVGASIVMGIAVCGMHYTGMAAMIMTPNDAQIAVDSGMEPLTLGLFIFCFSMLLLVLSLIVTMSQLQKRMYEELDDDEDDSVPRAQTI